MNYVRIGLLNGEISSKSVILHLLQMPSNLLTSVERNYLGLDRNYFDLCSDLSIAEVSLLHLKCAMLISRKKKERKRKQLRRLV